MSTSPLKPHDVQLASFDGERSILLALWNGLLQAVAPLARGSALPQSSR